jgi:peptidyl-prolyl cis-trans isomerase D
MFEFIRTHQRLTLGFLLLLIIPSFIFFGIEGYTRFTGGGNETVAKVDGVSITRAEWDQAHQRFIDRLRRQQPAQDTGGLDTPEARRETLEALVRERTLMAAANKLHLTPSTERVQEIFHSDPQYAALRTPDGKVNHELLSLQGMSAETLAAQIKLEVGMRQVLAGVERSSIAPAGASGQALDALLQRREAQVQRFDPNSYRTKANPTDADIEAFYKSRVDDFKAPEQAQIEYVSLDHEVLARSVEIKDDEARKFYDDNGARFTTPEERRASHILVKAGKDASADERAKARAKAEGLLEQARKNPAGFAELARKNSDDPGSAAQGGDLDFFGRGAMVKPFEDATWALKQGELSGVVQSDFGHHVILLTGTRGGQKKSFEDAKAEIVAELRKAAVARRWAGEAEQFNDQAYQHSESLQALVDKWKLARQTATVLRKPPPGTGGPLASPKLLDAIFSSDAVTNKRNTDAIEVAPNQLVVARITKHEPARTRTLAEVKEAVRERVVLSQAAALARKEGQERLAALRQPGAPADPIGNPLTISRMQTLGAPRSVIDAVMQADANKLPHLTGVDLGDDGYLLLRVTRVVPREAPPAGGEDPMRAQYAAAFGAAETEAYLAALKRRFKSEVKTAAAAAAAAASAPLR